MKNRRVASLTVAAGLPVLFPLTQLLAQGGGVNTLREWPLATGLPTSDDHKFSVMASGRHFAIAIVASSDPALNSTVDGWGEVGGIAPYGTPLERSCTSCLQPLPLAPGTKVKAVAAGWGHMAAILESTDPDINDTVYCWGDNTGTDLVVPVGVKFKAISVGESFTVGIVLDPTNEANDGTVRIWGWNEAFQGGIPGCGNLIPVTPPEGKFIAIAAGGHHIVLMRPDRTLLRMKGTCNEVYNIVAHWPGDAPTGQYRAIAAGHTQSLALRYHPGFADDWTLVRFDGQSTWAVNTDPLPAGQFTAIACGNRYDMALRGDGTIAIWGCMDGGGSCSGNGVPPTPPAGLEYGSISAGDYHGVGRINCYGNCDGSATPPILNVLDFMCFNNRFVDGDPWANCDHSTTPPILNVLDFTCFQNKFIECLGWE